MSSIPDFEAAIKFVSGTAKAVPLRSINAHFDYSKIQMLKDEAKFRLRQLKEEQILFNYRKSKRKKPLWKFIEFLKQYKKWTASKQILKKRF